MKKLSSGRRRAEIHNGVSAPPRLLLVPVAALFFSIACATAPTAAPVAPVDDPGLVASVLAACGGADRAFCSGYLEAAFGSVYAPGVICPPPLTPEDVERIALDALRDAPPTDAAIVHVRLAFDRAWPCSTPAPSDVTSKTSIYDAAAFPLAINAASAAQ